jgi:hypothetical protein
LIREKLVERTAFQMEGVNSIQCSAGFRLLPEQFQKSLVGRDRLPLFIRRRVVL